MDIDDFIMNRDEPRLLIVAGAGISAESGVPTFRDAGGLWEGHDISKVCTIGSFMENYELVHEFYNSRRTALKDIKPNYAHEKAVAMCHTYGKSKSMIITTNVDTLFEQCNHGDNVNIMHVHGNITDMIFDYGSDSEHVRNIGMNKHHPDIYMRKNSITKPGIVMFGECMRYDDGVKKAIYTDMDAVFSSLSSRDTVIVIGSSNTVVMFAELCWASPAHSININLRENADNSNGMFTRNMYMSATAGMKMIDESSTVTTRMRSYKSDDE